MHCQVDRTPENNQYTGLYKETIKYIDMSKFLGLKKHENHNLPTLYRQAVSLDLLQPHEIAVEWAIDLLHSLNRHIEGNFVNKHMAQAGKGDLSQVFAEYRHRLCTSMEYVLPGVDVEHEINKALRAAYRKCDFLHHLEIITILLSKAIGEEIRPIEDLLLAATDKHLSSYLSSINFPGTYGTYISAKNIIDIEESLVQTFQDIYELDESQLQNLVIIVYSRMRDAGSKLIFLKTCFDLGLKIESEQYDRQDEMKSLIKQEITLIEKDITGTMGMYKKFEVRDLQLKRNFINHGRIWCEIYESEDKSQELRMILEEAINETKNKVIVPVIAAVTEMCTGTTYSCLEQKMIDESLNKLLEEEYTKEQICDLLSICDKSHSFPPKKLSKLLEKYSQQLEGHDKAFFDCVKRAWQLGIQHESDFSIPKHESDFFTRRSYYHSDSD